MGHHAQIVLELETLLYAAVTVPYYWASAKVVSYSSTINSGSESFWGEMQITRTSQSKLIKNK